MLLSFTVAIISIYLAKIMKTEHKIIRIRGNYSIDLCTKTVYDKFIYAKTAVYAKCLHFSALFVVKKQL